MPEAVLAEDATEAGALADQEDRDAGHQGSPGFQNGPLQDLARFSVHNHAAGAGDLLQAPLRQFRRVRCLAFSSLVDPG